MKQERVCLKCSKAFQSTGVGNRICSDCRKNQKSILRPPISQVTQLGRKPIRDT